MHFLMMKTHVLSHRIYAYTLCLRKHAAAHYYLSNSVTEERILIFFLYRES